MKLFHTENGKEVVYVQGQDIIYLMKKGIYPSIFTKQLIIDDSNRFEVIRFDKEHEVKFFRELEFIIDYNQYKDLTDDQIDEEENKLASKANEIAKKWNSMTKEEQEQNKSLWDEHCDIMYMIMSICKVYAVKHNMRVMPFPEFVNLPEKTKKKPIFRKKEDVE